MRPIKPTHLSSPFGSNRASPPSSPPPPLDQPHADVPLATSFTMEQEPVSLLPLPSQIWLNCSLYTRNETERFKFPLPTDIHVVHHLLSSPPPLCHYKRHQSPRGTPPHPSPPLFPHVRARSTPSPSTKRPPQLAFIVGHPHHPTAAFCHQ
jgi:hypothetical protein